MDPRRPELSVSRVRELIKQYDAIEDKIAHATTSSQLGQYEREGGLVVQEICLVAPRMHEALIQTSRQRRHDLTRGIVEESVEIPKPGMMDKETAEKILDAIEKVAPKPKKKTAKKKKAE